MFESHQKFSGIGHSTLADGNQKVAACFLFHKDDIPV
jgi:hypothetical protein